MKTEHTYRLAAIAIAFLASMIATGVMYLRQSNEGALYFGGMTSTLLVALLDAARVYRALRNGNGH